MRSSACYIGETEVEILDLLILGAGGHGEVVKEIAIATKQYSKIAFLDDCFDDSNSKVIGKLADYERLKREYTNAFVAIGNPVVREQWQSNLINVGYSIPILIHPNAHISPSAHLDKGTVVMPKAVVQTNAKMGKGCIVCAGAIVDHNAEVGDYCHINVGAVVAANSKVPSGIKVDYNEVFRNSVGTPVADKGVQEQHRINFGTEISFF